MGLADRVLRSENFMHYDSIIVGSGFGGLGASLQLAELGQRVLLLKLKYPGGCKYL